jgi:hypothetical protein
MVVQYNTGVVTLAPALSGSNIINNRSSFTRTAERYAIVTLVQLNTNFFISAGDMKL